MTVKELIELLKKEKQNALVLVSSDVEGNAFSKLADGFGKGDMKIEPDWMLASYYGLEKEDLKKKYIILYPEC